MKTSFFLIFGFSFVVVVGRLRSRARARHRKSISTLQKKKRKKLYKLMNLYKQLIIIIIIKHLANQLN